MFAKMLQDEDAISILLTIRSSLKFSHVTKTSSPHADKGNLINEFKRVLSKLKMIEVIFAILAA